VEGQRDARPEHDAVVELERASAAEHLRVAGANLLTIVGMEVGEELLAGCRTLGTVTAEDPVHLERPGRLVGGNLPGPRTDVGDALCLVESQPLPLERLRGPLQLVLAGAQAPGHFVERPPELSQLRASSDRCANVTLAGGKLSAGRDHAPQWKHDSSRHQPDEQQDRQRDHQAGAGTDHDQLPIRDGRPPVAAGLEPLLGCVEASEPRSQPVEQRLASRGERDQCLAPERMGAGDERDRVAVDIRGDRGLQRSCA
jgi:hypothetical protein